MFQDQISIIIPFLNETKNLARLINFLEVQLWPGDEILLVKGVLSPDRKPENLSSHTSLFYAPRGRGNQLNLGARMAQNNLLWFLHADTCPPPNFGYHIRKISQFSNAVLGCFELRFSPTNVYLNIISKWANLRTRYLRLPYGDQGFFCTHQVFEELGGFKKRFLMEDVDFVRNSRKLGKLLVAPHRMRSSSQRYLNKGILRASLLNHLLVFLYFLGVNDKKLYARYYNGT
jgi:rSAM/selenodomain-associated transferase 2